MNNPVGGTFDKIDAIVDAYSQLRISGLTVEPTPEALETALDRLESMAAEWFERNICCGYQFEDEPDPNTPTGVRRGFKQAFATNLAVRLVPDFNKQVPATLFAQATQSLSNLSAVSAADRIKQVQYPSRMSRGSGNTLRYNRWARFYRLSGAAAANCKVNRMYIGDIGTFVEHFDAYLTDGETIASFSIVADTGVSITGSSNTDQDVNYTVEATGGSDGSAVGESRQVTIVITTSSGRVTTRVIQFELTPRPE